MVSEHLVSRKTTTLWNTDEGESLLHTYFAGLSVYLLMEGATDAFEYPGDARFS